MSCPTTALATSSAVLRSSGTNGTKLHQPPPLPSPPLALLPPLPSPLALLPPLPSPLLLPPPLGLLSLSLPGSLTASASFAGRPAAWPGSCAAPAGPAPPPPPPPGVAAPSPPRAATSPLDKPGPSSSAARWPRRLPLKLLAATSNAAKPPGDRGNDATSAVALGCGCEVDGGTSHTLG